MFTRVSLISMPILITRAAEAYLRQAALRAAAV